ncbi:MAG: phage major tail tube protein [Lachnospiraceae bacterium]|nr:phage major tail tube protein [Oscillospiraceae bacterium]MCD8361734.1 phage major tail tube protein [Lachnospiraceae bacterium]
MDQSIINFAVYEDDTEFCGMAEATLPDLSSLTETISGAGIAGNFEIPIIGHFDAMSLTLNFRTHTEESLNLCKPGYHTIQLYEAVQNSNRTAGTLDVKQARHVFKVIPKTYKAGKVAPAESAGASGEYAVHYWATYIDGDKVLEVDPENFICEMDGTDYLADVRSALGK